MAALGSQPVTPVAPVPNALNASGRFFPFQSHLSPHTPSSAASSSNTFLMPSSPRAGRNQAGKRYRPRAIRTGGQRPACLVNASVTYCGDDSIYAFGGFDQYTDEVYNHVLRLDLKTNTWSLVDNYGAIPGVRMGHTATLYQGNNLLIFGGENEHRAHLSDVIIFDINTAHWKKPTITGPTPRGRARHAAVLDGDRLWIIGGLTGHDNYVLDDICFLDLRTWTWSKTWRFVGRFDHSAWIWDNKMWVFGGLDKDMERGAELLWLDLKDNSAFNMPMIDSDNPALEDSPRVAGTSSYAANTSSVQISSFNSRSNIPMAPGAISSVKFVSGPGLPLPFQGTHHHAFSSGSVLDFVTPSQTIHNWDCCLASLDLRTLTWHKLAIGSEIFKHPYYWHYCALNEDGTKAWLLGCSKDNVNANGIEQEEYLSDVLPIDLKKYGLLGNSMMSGSRSQMQDLPASDRVADSSFSGLGADFSELLQNATPELGADFIITTGDDDDGFSSTEVQETLLKPDISNISNAKSPPIHVHKVILLARWPHFCRLYNSQMKEFRTKKMHIPEPYSVVKAFIHYLYTDSIYPAPTRNDKATTKPDPPPTLSDVAGMLVMSNLYDMPRLRLLCVNRLGKELDVEHAATIWECATVAQEDWLRGLAAHFVANHWGYVVRTDGFRRLSHENVTELCKSSAENARIVSGEELEAVGMARDQLQKPGNRLATAKGEESATFTDVEESEHEEEEDVEMG